MNINEIVHIENLISSLRLKWNKLERALRHDANFHINQDTRNLALTDNSDITVYDKLLEIQTAMASLENEISVLDGYLRELRTLFPSRLVDIKNVDSFLKPNSVFMYENNKIVTKYFNEVAVPDLSTFWSLDDAPSTGSAANETITVASSEDQLEATNQQYLKTQPILESSADITISDIGVYGGTFLLDTSSNDVEVLLDEVENGAIYYFHNVSVSNDIVLSPLAGITLNGSDSTINQSIECFALWFYNGEFRIIGDEG